MITTDQQSADEKALQRYQQILSGCGLDIGFAEMLSKAEEKDPEGAASLLRGMVEGAAVMKAKQMAENPTATQEVKKDSEAEDLRNQIEGIMLNGSLTAEKCLHPGEADHTDNLRNEDPKTAALRAEIEKHMFSGRMA